MDKKIIHVSISSGLNGNSQLSENDIVNIVVSQREYFDSGVTRHYDHRVNCLNRLKRAIDAYEREFYQALYVDLGKCEYESLVTEIGYCSLEIKETIRDLKKWMRPKRVRTSLMTQPGVSHIYYCPLGVNLIIAPYNYPVTLAFSPLIAAIAAGNTAVLKTSEMTPTVSAVIFKLVSDTFDPDYIACVNGGIEESTMLLQQKFDHIFFTGSPRVGSIVMQAAAKHLTPVTLELGGKSPCIVHQDAKQEIAVNRIVSGKFLNAGQTCIAPDYVMVHSAIKEDFLAALKTRIAQCYGDDPAKSAEYGRMVNDRHFERVCGLIDQKKVIVGGDSDAASRYIAPTVMSDVSLDDEIMSEEIFGPILPVLEYQDLDEVYQVVDQLPHYPLACYLFSESKTVQNEVIANIQFGGGCINNCVLHLVNSHLPFGGVGESGIGAYHGIHGFQRFSHKKGVLKSASWIDLPLLYPPFKNKFKFMNRLLK